MGLKVRGEFVEESLNSGVTQPAPTDAPKVMQQHEITALVTGAKQRGHEKGLQEGYEKAKAEIQNTGTQSPMQQSQPTAPGMDENRLRQIAAEEAVKQQQQLQAQWLQKQNEAQGQQILNEVNAKSVTAKSKFDDYDKVVDPEFKSFSQAPELVYYANMTDNPGEVLYDLAKNPAKMANIALMHRMGMGPQAVSEIKKLSDSIKVNEMSAQQPKQKAPLSQISPSTVGVGNVDEDSYSSRFKGKY